jgi:hypothetical protein
MDINQETSEAAPHFYFIMYTGTRRGLEEKEG